MQIRDALETRRHRKPLLRLVHTFEVKDEADAHRVDSRLRLDRHIAARATCLGARSIAMLRRAAGLLPAPSRGSALQFQRRLLAKKGGGKKGGGKKGKKGKGKAAAAEEEEGDEEGDASIAELLAAMNAGGSDDDDDDGKAVAVS